MLLQVRSVILKKRIFFSTKTMVIDTPRASTLKATPSTSGTCPRPFYALVSPPQQLLTSVLSLYVNVVKSPYVFTFYVTPRRSRICKFLLSVRFVLHTPTYLSRSTSYLLVSIKRDFSHHQFWYDIMSPVQLG